MKKYQLLFLITTVACCGLQDKKDLKIQNAQKAVHYFEDELNATTTPVGVQEAIDNKEHCVIVDVRDRKSYAAGHIPGAINVPIKNMNKMLKGSSIKSRIRPDAYASVLIKDGINYVYCYTLVCNLSSFAAKEFASLGYPVKEMRGGMEAWKEHKFKIEKST